MRKQSQINNRWSTSSGTELSTNNPNIHVNQIQEIFSKFQHQLEQNVRNINKSMIFRFFSLVKQSNISSRHTLKCRNR